MKQQDWAGAVEQVTDEINQYLPVDPEIANDVVQLTQKMVSAGEVSALYTQPTNRAQFNTLFDNINNDTAKLNTSTLSSFTPEQQTALRSAEQARYINSVIVSPPSAAPGYQAEDKQVENSVSIVDPVNQTTP